LSERERCNKGEDEGVGEEWPEITMMAERGVVKSFGMGSVKQYKARLGAFHIDLV